MINSQRLYLPCVYFIVSISYIAVPSRASGADSHNVGIIEKVEQVYPGTTEMFLRGFYLIQGDEKTKFGPWVSSCTEGSVMEYYNEIGNIISPMIVRDHNQKLVGLDDVNQEGAKSGLSIQVRPNGNLRQVCSYREGVLHGQWVIFDNSTNVLAKKIFDNGLLVDGYVFDQSASAMLRVVEGGNGSMELHDPETDAKVLEVYVEGRLTK